MMRFAFTLFAVITSTSQVGAQSIFNPAAVAYYICVTNETKRLALAAPPISKDLIVERSFRACSEDEAGLLTSLAERGYSQNAAEEQISDIKKFIRKLAEDDIDRFRVNRTPR